MVKINTYLHLAIKLNQRIVIKDLNSFLLGVAFSDNSQNLAYNHKESVIFTGGIKGLTDDFAFGQYFCLWVVDRIFNLDFEDISRYDRLICDMAVIAPYLQNLGQIELRGEKAKAFRHIMSLEREPMPLYMVSREKSLRYGAILDRLIRQFLKENSDIE